MSKKTRIVSLMLAAAVAVSLFALSGCGSDRMCDDLNADGGVVTAVVTGVVPDYVSLEGMKVTKVSVKDTEKAPEGNIYCCDITVANTYLSVTLDGDLYYSADGDGNEKFAKCTSSAVENWKITPLSGIKADTVPVEDLPNAESVGYTDYTIGKVQFDSKALTCTVEAYLDVSNNYVMVSGATLINYAFEDGKWTHTGFSAGKDFAMSWNIGGMWAGDEYKWNEKSDMRLKYEFDIHTIGADGTVEATVYSHITTGASHHQVDEFDVEGKIDFATMTMTMSFDKQKLLVATLGKDGFYGEITDSEDGFHYYTGPFTRQ